MARDIKRETGPLVVFKGDALRLLCTVRDGDGELVDISGATEIRFTISETAGGAAVVDKTLGDGTAVTNNSGFSVTLEGADTDLLTDTVYWPELDHATRQRITRGSIRSSYYYQCTVTTAGGDKYTVMTGRWYSRASTPEAA